MRECFKAIRRENFRDIANAMNSEPEKRPSNLICQGDLTKCDARRVLGVKNWFTRI